MKRMGLLTMKLLNENCLSFKYTFANFLRDSFLIRISWADSEELLRAAQLPKGSWRGIKNTVTLLPRVHECRWNREVTFNDHWNGRVREISLKKDRQGPHVRL